jgi:hypothetical protein
MYQYCCNESYVTFAAIEKNRGVGGFLPYYNELDSKHCPFTRTITSISVRSSVSPTYKELLTTQRKQW